MKTAWGLGELSGKQMMVDAVGGWLILYGSLTSESVSGQSQHYTVAACSVLLALLRKAALVMVATKCVSKL